MKRIGDIFDDICNLENLSLAFAKVQRSKASRPDVAAFRAHLEENLQEIRFSLLSGDYQFGDYHVFKVFDPKERTIYAAAVRERVIHHAVINCCGDILERCLIDDSYACRCGKGQWAAVARAQEFARQWPWCLKLDIKSYFDSIDQGVLFKLLGRKFKDGRLLNLFSRLLESYATAPGKGLPIGNLTSQYFANLYLDSFDRLASGTRGRDYVRYMDDMLVFGEKTELMAFWRRAEEFLREPLALTIKNGGSMEPTARGVDFLGCRIFPGHLTLNHRSRVRFKRKRKDAIEQFRQGDLSEDKLQQRLTALYAFVRHADTKFMRSRIADIISGDLA